LGGEVEFEVVGEDVGLIRLDNGVLEHSMSPRANGDR
jgi:hypothetical protein